MGTKIMIGATDEQLMLSVAAGDLEAFEELVLRYQGLAWKTAYRFLGDRVEAEDVAQETFLKILKAAQRYRPTAAFRTYFYRILTHLCIDRTRKKYPITGIDEMPDAPDPSCDPIESIIAKERQAQVQHALATLPANQKAAIILRHYEGLSYAEISKILSVTRKAVEGLISRARTSLQAILSPGN
jgi:RNA polymerase sigma-70 factor, ECF subfamily